MKSKVHPKAEALLKRSGYNKSAYGSVKQPGPNVDPIADLYQPKSYLEKKAPNDSIPNDKSEKLIPVR